MERCTIVSWNLNGLDEEHLDERTEAACLSLLLRPEPASVIALQEVVRRSWHAHVKHHLHHAGYTVVPTDPTATDSEYFSLLAVRSEIGIQEAASEPFPGSHMGRALVWARAGGWWFGTGHLESGSSASRERLAQLALVASRLAAEPGPAVFAGDTNLRRDETDGVPAVEHTVDAWVEAGAPASAKSTWLGGRYGARFDRVLHNGRIETRSLWTTGHKRTDGVRPSDHLALWATLEIAP